MLKNIPIKQLRLGMFIQTLGGRWVDHPFWRSSFKLVKPEDMQALLQSGIPELVIDTDKGLDVEVAPEFVVQSIAPVPVVQEKMPPTVPQVSYEQEIENAKRIQGKAKQAVTDLFNQVRMGKAIELNAIEPLVEEINLSVERNSGALLSIVRLKTVDDYTYMHSVAVCALMVSLAKQLGLDEQATREAGMAGLMHDVGKALMPMDVLNKPGKLTDDEFRIIKSHPVEGHRLLSAGQSVSDIVLDVCLHHHEKIDGSGYPDKLAGDQISLYAKMGAVCDVYDAITSNRPYKKGWDPAESIQKMSQWSKGHFDENVFQAFVKSIGIYPAGSLVKLGSGRLAVVLEQSEKSLLAPRIKVFFSTKSQTYIVPEVLDLSHPSVTEKIVGREDAATWGIKNLDELWAS